MSESDEEPVRRTRSTRDRGARHNKVTAALERMKAAREKTESRAEQYQVTPRQRQARVFQAWRFGVGSLRF